MVDTGIDASLDTVKNSVDFAVIKDAMAEFQQIYVEKTVEIPLYYRKNVELVGPKLGNFFANPTQAGPTWNASTGSPSSNGRRLRGLCDNPASGRPPRGAPPLRPTRAACATIRTRPRTQSELDSLYRELAGPAESGAETGGEPMTKYIIRR